MKKCSLIIPVYNEKNIDVILDSVEKQINIGKKEFELILVNDGGTLTYDHIIKNYEIDCKYIYISKNRGRAYARNLGAINAESELLVFSDGDRILHPNFLAQHVLMHKKKKCVVIGDIVEVFCRQNQMSNIKADVCAGKFETNKIPKYRNNYADIVLKIYDASGSTKSDVPWISLFSANFSIPKEIHQRIDGFSLDFFKWGYENIDYGYKLWLNNVEFCFNKEAVNYHIYHKQDRTLNVDSKKIFYQKHKNALILRYFQFLEGKLSLQDIDTNCELREKVYFYQKKIGKKIIIIGDANNGY